MQERVRTGRRRHHHGYPTEVLPTADCRSDRQPAHRRRSLDWTMIPDPDDSRKWHSRLCADLCRSWCRRLHRHDVGAAAHLGKALVDWPARYRPHPSPNPGSLLPAGSCLCFFFGWGCASSFVPVPAFFRCDRDPKDLDNERMTSWSHPAMTTTAFGP